MENRKTKALTIETASQFKFREKRKWQIALRRYVLERNICAEYAPYFGLDIENMRRWFECQFKDGIGWENFAEKWQFEHIIPVAYFDFSNKEELSMCWNFTNLGVEIYSLTKEKGYRLDLTAAKKYYQELFEHTGYPICRKLLLKIDEIESANFFNSELQQAFIKAHRDYLAIIENFTSFEFELINRGRDINEINKELEFLKKYDKPAAEDDKFATDV